MKSFSQFNKSNKFCWGDGDIEHHSSNLKEEAPQNFNLHANNDHDPAVSQFKKHGESLSSETLRHVRRYKIDSEHLNKSLRGDKPVKKIHHIGAMVSKPMIDHIDKATDNKLSHHLTVYRGGSGKNSPNSKVMKTVGHEFTDHGYTSTTLDHHVAHDFSDNENKKKRHIFAIHLKPGDKAHHLDMHQHENQHEHEVLLHRGTRFRVTGHSKHNENRDDSTTHVTHLEVVHQQPREVKAR